MEMEFRDAEVAFQEAITKGRMVDPPNGIDAYAGDYMYMGTAYGIDLFKHIMTRRYLYYAAALEQLEVDTQ